MSVLCSTRIVIDNISKQSLEYSL